jgi:hypothetical protein
MNGNAYKLHLAYSATLKVRYQIKKSLLSFKISDTSINHRFRGTRNHRILGPHEEFYLLGYVLQSVENQPLLPRNMLPLSSRLKINYSRGVHSVARVIKPQDKALVRNNWQMRLIEFSSITSRHVSASTCGHLQVISMT